MSIPLSPLANTQTFGTWLTRTNDALAVISSNAVTADSTGGGSKTTGNAFVIGIFGANTLYTTTLSAGNISSSGSLLTITSNTQINATATIGNSTVNVQIGWLAGNASIQQSFANANNFVQNIVQNSNTGPAASGDFVAYNDDGSYNTFIDMGINSSGWANTLWTINGYNDGYLYVGNGALAVGTNTAGKQVVFFTGGTLYTNERMRIDGGGNVGISNTNPNAKLAVTGTANISSNVYIGGAITGANTLSITGNVSISNTIDVVGAASLSNTLTVTGNATLSNTLAVTGNTVLANTLAVTGNVVLSNTIAVTGNATLSNTLAVTGSVSLSNTINVVGAANLQSSANVGGTLGVALATSLANTLDVVGAANLQYSVNVGGTLGVSGAITLSNNVWITGNVGISNNSFLDNLRVEGTISALTSVTVGNSSANAIVANLAGIYSFSNSIGSYLGNTTSRWILNANTINASGLITGTSGLDITGTSNASVAMNVGANVNLTTTSISVGNSTENSAVSSNILTLSNSTVNATMTGLGLAIGGSSYTSSPYAYLANSITNTTITSASIYIGNSAANSTQNSSGLYIAGNTTTLAATTLASNNLTIGNSTVTAAPVITLQNSSTNSVLTSLGLNLGSGSTVANTIGVYTTNVNAASHTVGADLVANSIGIYHTGTVNAASHTVGADLVANSIGIYHTGTVNAASFTVGSAYSVNSTSLVANGASLNSTALYVSGFTNSAAFNVGTSFTANSTLVNAASIATYTNTVTLGTASYFVSNGNLGVGNSAPTDKVRAEGTLSALTSVSVSNSSVAAFVANTSGVFANTGSNVNIGTVGTANGVAVNSSQITVGNSTAQTVITGNSVSTNSATFFNITINGSILGTYTSSGSIIPGANNAYTLGSSGNTFSNVFATSMYTNTVYAFGSAITMNSNVTVTGAYLGLGGITDFYSNSFSFAGTTAGAANTVDAFDTATYRSAEYLVQMSDIPAVGTNSYHISKLLVVHDGSAAYVTEFGSMATSSNLVSYAADVNGGNVRLRGTATSNTITVKFSRQTVKI